MVSCIDGKLSPSPIKVTEHKSILENNKISTTPPYFHTRKTVKNSLKDVLHF